MRFGIKCFDGATLRGTNFLHPRNEFHYVKEVISIHDSWPMRGRKEVFHAIFMITLWCIWKARNERVFSGIYKFSSDVLNDVMLLSFIWPISNRGKCVPNRWSHWCVLNFNV